MKEKSDEESYNINKTFPHRFFSTFLICSPKKKNKYEKSVEICSTKALNMQTCGMKIFCLSILPVMSTVLKLLYNQNTLRYFLI